MNIVARISSRARFMNHATSTLLKTLLVLLTATSALADIKRRSEILLSADGSQSAFTSFGDFLGDSVPYTFAPVRGFTPLIPENPDITALPVLPDTDSVSVNAISANGDTIVGRNDSKAVVWRNNTITALPVNVADTSFSRASADFVSADGTVVVGSVFGNYQETDEYFEFAFRWTDAGTVFLSGLDEDSRTYASAITPDATTIVGVSSNPGLTIQHAVYWRGTTITDIHPDGMVNSFAQFVSEDGQVIAVQAYDGDEDQAYRWTAANGTQPLGEARWAYTNAISASGDVFVGQASFEEDSNGHAFRWTAAGGLQDIHPASLLPDADFLSSGARFVSRDGTKIFGYISDEQRNIAFRWTTDGVIDIGNLGGNITSVNAITPDGRVAVGRATTTEDRFVGTGFRWTELDGIQTIEAWLAASGITLADDIVIGSAEGVSDDGSVITGYLEDDNAYFIAKGDSGLITLADLQQSIAGTTAAVSSTRTSASLVLNGAHGHPMSRRAETGRFIAWAGGDYGQDNHGERDGHLSVAEAGGGYNFGPAQLNLALGRTDSLQDTPFNGDVDHTGTFGIVDVIIPVPSTPLYVTVTGIYQDSTLDIRRGYLNGGLPDRSDADTDAETYGGALRVDWLNACNVFGVDLTPFTKLVITRSKIDGYTEIGGGFPAVFQTQRDTVSDLHLGANASYALRKNVRLVATLEGVYRFQENASPAGVSVPGVTLGFTSIAGEDYKQAWLSGGLGAEYDVGAGTFSVMLNGTTEGAASNLWLASSYQYKF
jgi:uncharacterized membrane protein